MAETLSGGATKRADGTWQDAEGRPLDKTRIKEAEAILEEQQQAKAEIERIRLQGELARSNAVRELIGLAPQPTKPEPTKTAEK